MEPPEHARTDAKWGWSRVRLGRGKRLWVWAPAGESCWTEVASLYASGELPALARVGGAPSSVVHRGPLPGLSGVFYLKRFLARGWRDRALALVRASRAMRDWRGSRLVAAAGIGVPRLRCVIEERAFGIRTAGVSISEAIEPAATVHAELFLGAGLESLGPAERRLLLGAFARNVGAWHRAGLCHGDMHMANVLCRREDGVWRFWWLDHENSMRDGSIRARARNLTDINRNPRVATTDRFRFWRAYCEAAAIPAADREALLREVIRRSRRRWKRFPYDDRPAQA
jgi:tRNA A-37 threonylcarbamoyl transferase component Bud32